MFRDYKVPAELKPRPSHRQETGLTWADLLKNWRTVVFELSAVCGIHFETTDLPWPAIRDRIIELVQMDGSRLRTAVN